MHQHAQLVDQLYLPRSLTKLQQNNKIERVVKARFPKIPIISLLRVRKNKRE